MNSGYFLYLAIPIVILIGSPIMARRPIRLHIDKVKPDNVKMDIIEVNKDIHTIDLNNWNKEKDTSSVSSGNANKHT